jgi:hypothetical protein
VMFQQLVRVSRRREGERERERVTNSEACSNASLTSSFLRLGLCSLLSLIIGTKVESAKLRIKRLLAYRGKAMRCIFVDFTFAQISARL